MSIGQYGEEIGHEEIETFLESRGIGTLAFGNKTGGYAISMSFGYDWPTERCIFQFAFGDESREAAFIDEGIVSHAPFLTGVRLMTAGASFRTGHVIGFQRQTSRKRPGTLPRRRRSPRVTRDDGERLAVRDALITRLTRSPSGLEPNRDTSASEQTRSPSSQFETTRYRGGHS